MPVQAGNTILIVDDSEELLDVLRIVLEKQGHHVITKNSPDNLIHIVHENKIGLLLLDIFFGEGTANGRDICKELKSNPLTNYFPVIIMSVTYDLLGDFQECEADEFIEKPFALHDLMKKINTCLHKEPAS